MKIMLIFLVASNKRVPLNLAQTRHYLSHLYPLDHRHNCYQNRHLLIKPLKMKVQKHSKNNLVGKSVQKIKNSYLQKGSNLEL